LCFLFLLLTSNILLSIGIIIVTIPLIQPRWYWLSFSFYSFVMLLCVDTFKYFNCCIVMMIIIDSIRYSLIDDSFHSMFGDDTFVDDDSIIRWWWWLCIPFDWSLIFDDSIRFHSIPFIPFDSLIDDVPLFIEFIPIVDIDIDVVDISWSDDPFIYWWRYIIVLIIYYWYQYYYWPMANVKFIILTCCYVSNYCSLLLVFVFIYWLSSIILVLLLFYWYCLLLLCDIIYWLFQSDYCVLNDLQSLLTIGIIYYCVCVSSLMTIVIVCVVVFIIIIYSVLLVWNYVFVLILFCYYCVLLFSHYCVVVLLCVYYSLIFNDQYYWYLLLILILFSIDDEEVVLMLLLCIHCSNAVLLSILQPIIDIVCVIGILLLYLFDYYWRIWYSLLLSVMMIILH